MTSEEYLEVLTKAGELRGEGRSIRVTHSGDEGSGDYFVEFAYAESDKRIRLHRYGTWREDLIRFYNQQGGDPATPPRRVRSLVQVTLGGAAMLFLAGFAMSSVQPMPRHATVFIDPVAEEYFAPGCSPPPTSARSTAAEAYRLHYRPNPACRDSSGFIQDSRSLSGMLLERAGILSPLPGRWNPDGSWNW